MKMFKIIRILTVVTMIVAISAPALAADFVGGGGNDLWSNGANWDPTGVPDVASGGLNINANATVQTTFNEIGGIMAIGADLIINADLKYPAEQTNQDVTMGGSITQNAGDVYFSDDMRTHSDAIHTMNGGTFVLRDYYRWDSASLLDIRGGSFTIGNYLGINGKTGTLKVVGDAATLISFGALTGFGNGTLDIVLKDGGITTIDVGGTVDLPGTLNVTLDAGFTPPVAEYILISAGSLSGTLDITPNLPSGEWTVAPAGNDLVLTFSGTLGGGSTPGTLIYGR
jgi:hypothetical protein